MIVAINSINEPGRLADTISAQLVVAVEKKQALLEIPSVRERLEELVLLLGSEMEILQLEKKLHVRVRKQ